jgi:hypothetical protein
MAFPGIKNSWDEWHWKEAFSPSLHNQKLLNTFNVSARSMIYTGILTPGYRGSRAVRVMVLHIVKQQEAAIE